MNDLYIDTNVFIRLFLQDIQDQYNQARDAFEKVDKGETRALVSILVVGEIVWVLEKYYLLKRKNFITQLLKLLSLDNIRILEAKKELIIKVLEKMKKTNFDFTDVYLAYSAKPDKVFSFDKDFERLK